MSSETSKTLKTSLSLVIEALKDLTCSKRNGWVAMSLLKEKVKLIKFEDGICTKKNAFDAHFRRPLATAVSTDWVRGAVRLTSCQSNSMR